MLDNIDEKKLLDELKRYREQNGYDGLFGLIAKLAPNNVDKDDMENYKKQTPSMIIDKVSSRGEIVQFETSFNKPVHNASTLNTSSIEDAQIIKPEYMDLVELDKQQAIEQPKTKILGPDRKTPNPWTDAKIVTPGHLKLK